MSKAHSLKHNAKASAVRLCAKFSGIEVMEPVRYGEGWHPRVIVIDGVLPSSLAPEIAQAAVLVLPPGWEIVDGGIVARQETPADNPYLETAERFAALNPDGQDLPAEVDAALSDIAVSKALDAALSGVKAGSKEAVAFAMLRRPEGVTVAALAAVFGWKVPSTRSYISVRTRHRGVAAVTVDEPDRGLVYRLALPAPATVEA